jgi:hypothetical protein
MRQERRDTPVGRGIPPNAAEETFKIWTVIISSKSESGLPVTEFLCHHAESPHERNLMQTVQ